MYTHTPVPAMFLGDASASDAQDSPFETTDQHQRGPRPCKRHKHEHEVDGRAMEKRAPASRSSASVREKDS